MKDEPFKPFGIPVRFDESLQPGTMLAPSELGKLIDTAEEHLTATGDPVGFAAAQDEGVRMAEEGRIAVIKGLQSAQAE